MEVPHSSDATELSIPELPANISKEREGYSRYALGLMNQDNQKKESLEFLLKSKDSRACTIKNILKLNFQVDNN